MTNISFMEKGKAGREKGKTTSPNKGREVLPFPLIPSPFSFQWVRFEFQTPK
jgi:hypothetical protein